MLARLVGKIADMNNNERGKGDHRHFGDNEKPYHFYTPRLLIADFEADIVRWNRENSDS